MDTKITFFVLFSFKIMWACGERLVIGSFVFAGHKVLCFKQNLGDRFSSGYIWGIIDVKGIVFGSSKW